MDRLTKFTLQVLAEEKLPRLLQFVLQDLLEVVGGREGSVYLLSDGEYKRAHTTYTPTPYSASEDEISSLLRKKICGKDDELAKYIDTSEVSVYESAFAVPLKYRDRQLGAIFLLKPSDGNLPNEKIQRLRIMGSIATLAIKNLQLSSKVSKALKKRELFIATAAHELRTPLSVISSYNQIVKKKISQGKPVKENWIKSIARNSKKLEFLITDLFSTARISSGLFSFTMKQLDLKKLLQKTVSDLSMLYDQTIEFQSKLDTAKIQADKSKMTILFTNLITNACKYSLSDSTVRISLSKRENAIVVSVIDQGQGIKAQELKKIFKKNYQSSDSKGSGLGLGLYLCKKITEGHGGTITVTSQKSKGTTVTVTLPIEG